MIQTQPLTLSLSLASDPLLDPKQRSASPVLNLFRIPTSASILPPFIYPTFPLFHFSNTRVTLPPSILYVSPSQPELGKVQPGLRTVPADGRRQQLYSFCTRPLDVADCTSDQLRPAPGFFFWPMHFCSRRGSNNPPKMALGLTPPPSPTTPLPPPHLVPQRQSCKAPGGAEGSAGVM